MTAKQIQAFQSYFNLIQMSREGYELTGQKIQGYTISKPIGQGKFSIVYRAQNEQGVAFALKKIKIFDMADQRQREKCLKEVDIMKKLNHPHIIQYIDSFIHNNELIIVTEWAEKGDLKKLIKEKESDELQFDEPSIWEYMKQISSALQHMHEKRIMHRDLKPANIFISSDGSLKIGDLGLGRSFSSETLEAYSKVGTPLYMSPELIQDSGYTQNADVWSLGCICYELAELKSPFRNKEDKMSLMDLFDNITKCNYKPIDSRFTPQLREAIRSMIVVDPSQRWSSQQVFNYAQKCLQQVKRSLLDPIIAMDDISIKLNLLSYQTNFCKAAERKPFHKLYFALQDSKGEQNNQLFYFLQLSYWIMALSKPDKKKDKLAIYTKTLIDWSSPESACKKLLTDIGGYGVKLEQNISPGQLIHGYGEAVCFILNQLLTRELIRMNFQFQAPSQGRDESINKRDDFEQDKNQKQVDDEQKSLDQESLEEQSQFQQSILFNKNARKDRNINQAFIDKIQQLQEQQNRMMIVGRADEKEWKAECLRLQKKLGDLAIGAKQARKKNGYNNVETARMCTAKLTDLIKFVKPNTTAVFRGIEDNLERIKKGENRIRSSFEGYSQKYCEKNQANLQLNARANALSNYLRQSGENLEKIENKLIDINEKAKVAGSDNDANKVKDIKAAISILKKELLGMDQKTQIFSWELRRHLLKQKNRGKDDYLEINYLEQL